MKKVNPVTDDGSAERETVLQPLVAQTVRGASTAARESVGSPVRVRGPAQLVRARLRDRVDERAGEIAVSDVVRRHEHLILLHGIDRNRPAIGDIAVDETLVHAVDEVVVEAQVCARGGHAGPLEPDLGRDLRSERDEIQRVPIHRRQPRQQRVADDGGRPSTGQRPFRPRDGQCVEPDRRRLQHELEIDRLAEREREWLASLWREP
jgi:hypothetical protein